MYNANMNDIDYKSSKENTLSASELKTVLYNHKIWLETSGRDGESANLKDCYLKGAVLLGADLSNADLEGANLYGAYFKNANLENCNFRGANLRILHRGLMFPTRFCGWTGPFSILKLRVYFLWKI